jgi:nucleoside-diphosphate kinase|tara:strand:+ start:179 stop:580 length:402 start_codon:yes stop_codon:yes gene_type:complete
MDDKTFMMIKPDAVERGLIGKILADIIDAGFQIIELKMVKLSLNDAKRFYKVHQDRPFFNDLTAYMSRSTIVAAVLLKENAVNDFRKLIGSTDPSDAEEGTIRKKYAISKGENSVHGSDSNENAEIESNFHFL